MGLVSSPDQTLDARPFWFLAKPCSSLVPRLPKSWAMASLVPRPSIAIEGLGTRLGDGLLERGYYLIGRHAKMEDVDVPLEKLYECFSQSKNGEDIIRSFKNLKSRLKLNSLHGLDLYKALKEKLGTQKTWKAREVFQLLEKRANQKEYMQQTAAEGLRVMIVGAGPIGLRQAIECVLLGTEVIVVEKRSSFAKRNNVLHLWPCTIEDLRQLGANKFYGKFCAGVIDHISKLSLATQCTVQDMKAYPRHLVSEPDPSRGGGGKGLGTCLHSSCPHGMQLGMVIRDQLRYHACDHSRPARCSPRLLQTLAGNAVRHSDLPCLVAGDTESLEKNRFPDVICNQRF